MANAFYLNAHTGLVSGAINWSTSGYFVEFVAVTSGYTFNAAHVNLSDIPVGNRITRMGPGGTSCTSLYVTTTSPERGWVNNVATFGAYTPSIMNLSNIPGASVATAFVLYHVDPSGLDTHCTLIAYYDTFDTGSVPFNTTGMQYALLGTKGFFTNDTSGNIIVGQFELHSFPASVIGLVSADHRWPANKHTRCGPFFSNTGGGGTPPFHPKNLYCVLEKIDDGGTGLRNIDIFKSTDLGLTWSNIVTLGTQTSYPNAPSPYPGGTCLGGFSCSFDRNSQTIMIAVQTTTSGAPPFGLKIYKFAMSTDTLTTFATLPTTWPIPLVFHFNGSDNLPTSRFSITALGGNACIIIHPRATYQNVAGTNYDRVAWSYYNGTAWSISNADVDPDYSSYTTKTFYDTPVDAVATAFSSGAQLFFSRFTVVAPIGGVLASTTCSVGGSVNPRCQFFGVGASTLLPTNVAFGVPVSPASPGLGSSYGFGGNAILPYVADSPVVLAIPGTVSALTRALNPGITQQTTLPAQAGLTPLQGHNGVDITFNPNDCSRIHMVYTVGGGIHGSGVGIPTMWWLGFSDVQTNLQEQTFAWPIQAVNSNKPVYNEQDFGSNLDDAVSCSVQCVQTAGDSTDPFQIMIIFEILNLGYTPIAGSQEKGVYYTVFTPAVMRVPPSTATTSNYAF